MVESRCESLKTMNKDTVNNKSELPDDEMRSEYNFAAMQGGVRGKYHKAYRAGHTVEVHQADETVDTRYFSLEDGAVMLEPDVRKYFPDSDAVNEALRCLIPLVSKQT